MEEPCYRIGELARLAGVSQRTVDYYTRLDLIKPMQRTGGNYRIYDESALRRLHLIKAMQAQRYPLAEIAAKLESSSNEAIADLVEQVQAVGRDLVEVERKLAALGVAVMGAAVGEEQRRTISKTAGEALVRTLVMAQYLASIVGEGWPPV